MPKPPIAPFAAFERSEFHIGGNPDRVMEVADTWLKLADALESTAADMASMDTQAFLGHEADMYRVNLNGYIPNQGITLSLLHGAVGEDISSYGDLLAHCLAEMWMLVHERARPDHAALQEAITEFNAAETNAIAAREHAVLMESMALANPAMVPAAVAAEDAAVIAEGLKDEAERHYKAMFKNWEMDRTEAKNLKEKLGNEVGLLAARINAYEKTKVQDGRFVGKVGSTVDSLFPDVAKALRDGDLVSMGYAAGDHAILSLTGAGLLSEVAAYIIHLSQALRGDATGESVWNESHRVIPDGGRVRGVAKPGRAVTKSIFTNLDTIADLRSMKDNPEGIASRGDLIIASAEPVDMATGAWIDHKVDVSIEGILPIMIERKCDSHNFRDGVFGQQWVSNLDCRIEIFDDTILMLATDGAVITFPSPQKAGEIVRGKGRPWTLYFAEGAYHVHDIDGGLTYVFALGGNYEDFRPKQTFSAPKNNLNSDLKFDSLAMPGSSLAKTLGMGFVVKLTAMYNRVGHWIEYIHDSVSGLIKKIHRSDGTTLYLVWDFRVERLASISVGNEIFPDNHELLISYRYDAHGFLREVINSAPGTLAYHYNSHHMLEGWTDRNGISYYNRFDEQGRVIAQAGSGGAFANACVWLPDEGSDAPEGGHICVAIETAATLRKPSKDRTRDYVDINKTLDRLRTLPLVAALEKDGLIGAGLVGNGRVGCRSNELWNIPQEWLRDDVLGDIRPTVYRSNSSGDVWRIIKPSGACTDLTYNGYHQVVSRIDAAGDTTSWIYNEDGCLITTTYPDGTTEKIHRGENSNPQWLEDRAGRVTELISNECGIITGAVAPSGACSYQEYSWSPSGLVPFACADEGGNRIELEHDKAGRLIATIAQGDVRESVIRDHCGRVIEKIDTEGRATKFKYSPEGWLWLTTNPDGSEKRLTYDGEGNVVQVVDELGNTAVTEYAAFDKPARRTDFSGLTTEFVYNTQMETVAVINSAGEQWNFGRNLDGELISQQDYNGVVTRFSVNESKRSSQTSDALGNVAISWYDFDGRIVREQHNDVVTLWNYGTAGNLISVKSDDASVYYLYDDTGRYVGEKLSYEDGEVAVVEQHYDVEKNNAVSTITLPDGQIFSQIIELDNVGDVAGISCQINGLSVAELAFDNDPNRSRRNINIDNVSRIVNYGKHSLKTSDLAFDLRTQSLIAGRSWHRDRGGRVISSENANGNSQSYVLRESGEVSNVAHSFLGNISKALSEHYQINKDGTILPSQVHDFGLHDLEGMARSARREGSEAESSHIMLNGPRVDRIGHTKYRYDAIGRVVETTTERKFQNPLIKRFSYHGGSGLLSSFTSSDYPNETWYYSYDGIGRRVAKQCFSALDGSILRKTLFMYSGDQLVAEVTTCDRISRPLKGAIEQPYGRIWVRHPESGELIGQVDLMMTNTADLRDQKTFDAKYYVIIADLASAPYQLIDPIDGVVVGEAQQSAYGRRRWAGVVDCPLLFKGQYEDLESRWAYNRNRYYDPYSGRYGSPDPAGIAPNPANPYAYVKNPVTQTDPLGLNACDTLARQLQHTRNLTDDERKTYDVVNERLKIHRDAVIEEWNQGKIEYTGPQLKSIEEAVKADQPYSPQNMYRGTQLDVRMKELVEEDPILGKIKGFRYTPQGGEGPDFEIVGENGERLMWWDLTTDKSAPQHLRDYGYVGDLQIGDHIIGYQDKGLGEYRGITNPLDDAGHDYRGFVDKIDLGKHGDY